MKNVLRRANRAILTEFAHENVLLALDFDGTLAPISPLRDCVAMRPRTARLLKEAAHCFPCAVISGRSREDVSARISGTDVHYVIGNHGLESDSLGYERDEHGERDDWAARMLAQIEPRLAQAQGIEFENKHYSLTLHYRNAPSPAAAQREIRSAVQNLADRPRVIGGKFVVNLMPANSPHKGTALAALVAREGLQRVIYVGDDVTDEDVFNEPSLPSLLGIRVGRSEKSAARYYLRNQKQVDVLLAMLISERTRPGPWNAMSTRWRKT